MASQREEPVAVGMRHLLGQAVLKPDEAGSGAVTLIQRFGSAANLNIHLHCLVALRFDLPEFSKANAQSEALSRAMFEAPRNHAFNLRLLYEELFEEDTSHYHAHVLHAFVYASAGRWFSARTLCRIALVVADSIPEVERGKRRGREAAYLMAVAERRLAFDQGGIARAASALQDARQRQSKGADRDDVRFRCEEFAQSVTQLQLDHFLGKAVVKPDLSQKLRTVQILCKEVIDDTEELHSVRRWVVRQSITNGFILALLALDRGDRFPELLGELRRLLDLLRDEGLAPNNTLGSQKYMDEVSDFIWLVAAAKFGRDPVAHMARAALEGWQPTSQHESATAFEESRYKCFMKLVGLTEP